MLEFAAYAVFAVVACLWYVARALETEGASRNEPRRSQGDGPSSRG